MFDPTIYENLKVVAEGAVYDLDLKGELLILGRSDRVELASMSRAYAIRFRLPDKPEASAEFRLEADTYDLSAEILEKRDAVPGCRLELFFQLTVNEVESQCLAIQSAMREIWGTECRIRQQVTFDFDHQDKGYRVEASVDFGRKFGEEVIGDLQSLLEHMAVTLRRLAELTG